MLSLQGEMFAGLLQDIVSILNFSSFMLLTFMWGFLRELFKGRVLNIWYLFRKGFGWTLVQWNPFWLCLRMRNKLAKWLLWKRFEIVLWDPN